MNQDELLLEMSKLKSSHRRTLIAAACFAVTLAFLASWETFRTRSVIKSRSFVLVDATGKNIGVLKPQGDGACLELITPSKTSAATVCSADSLGSYISLLSRDGETQAMLSTGESVSEAAITRFPPGLVIATQNGQKLFSLRLGSDSKLLFGDPSGTRGMTVVIPAAGEPLLNLRPTKAEPARHREPGT